MGDNYLAVVDGVTARDASAVLTAHPDPLTPGAFAAQEIAHALDGLDSKATAQEAFAFLSDWLSRACETSGLSAEAQGWPAAASVAIFSVARKEVWQLGDVSVLVNGRPLPTMKVPLDEPATGYRAAVLWALLASGESVDELRDNDPTWPLLLPLLELQHHLRNCPDPDNPFAYYLLDGRPVPPSAPRVTAVPKGAEVVFSSDGYPEPMGTLSQTEGRLALLQQQDPLAIGRLQGYRPVPRGDGSFDDRSYLRFVC